jgi:hypothetical protein
MKSIVARYLLPLALLAAFINIAAFAQGSKRVRGYTKRSGTYVQSHRRTNADHTRRNNWSTKGNINPYTGKRGTKTPRR